MLPAHSRHFAFIRCLTMEDYDRGWWWFLFFSYLITRGRFIEGETEDH